MPNQKKDPKKAGVGINWQREDDTFADDSKVAQVLKKLHKRSEEEEASQMAAQLGAKYLDLNIFPVDQENVALIPKEKAQELGIVLVHRRDRKVKVGMLNPRRSEALDFLEEFQKKEGFKVEVYVISKSSFERAIESYDKIKLVNVFDYLRMGLSGADLEKFEKDLKDLVNLEKRIQEVPITEVLNIIIAGAMKLNASDIHLEPAAEEKVRLRYRIDGVLQTVAEFPIKIYSPVVSRVKVLAGMMLNVHDTSQDGRFSIKLEDGQDMGMRVSIIPSNYGENIVIRLLNQSMEDLNLDKVGLKGVNYDWLVEQSEKKQGMIINSGPTGSGKTTTLYSIINRVNTSDKKIISIEDPIEYQMKGVNQTQIDEKKGYTFADGLRAIVRQDPDVILVGEIRDEVTAETAIHAALTGHLVLTTVHANNAAGVIGRIIDLGVKPTLIGPATNALVAQRLVRRLCPHCKEKYEPATETVDTIKKILSLISPRAKLEIPKKIDFLWRPKGCVKCKGIGYRGRTGIFEILNVDTDIRILIENIATEDEIRSAALEKGMVTLEQDGMLKAIKGETSLEELQRVVGKGEYLMEIYEKVLSQTLSGGIMIKKDLVKEIANMKDDRAKLRKKLSQVDPSEMIKYVLTSALLTEASDIHIEPSREEFKIRYRIDGVLHDVVSLPMSEFLNLLSEIKNLAGFKTESRQGVIDGRFQIVFPGDVEEVKEEIVDVRLSIILGGMGDIAVMRLLSQKGQKPTLESLNVHPVNLKKIQSQISKPNGIILNTGPTGSGKTTTLYGILNHLNKPELKIITVEDPIEYQMDGLIQTQVNEKENYTFATAMKSLLRQNPDIMMIGEIRDQDTAKIAYQAALTGHLVLSTLHTNNAAGSVQRLLNMGLNVSDIAAGTNCFMAQRLVRILCPKCKKKRITNTEEKQKIEGILNSISPEANVQLPQVSEIFDSIGCEECHGLGYKGQVPIVEVLEVAEEMEKFLVTSPTTTAIKNKAVELGMLTLAQDGILKVLEGVTSLDEVARITRDVEN